MQQRIAVILFGPNASGKGTASKKTIEMLARRQVFAKHISTGDEVRKEKERYAAELDARSLIDHDEEILRIIEKETPLQGHLILDGAPRRPSQTGPIHRFLKRQGFDIKPVQFELADIFKTSQERTDTRDLELVDGGEEPRSDSESLKKGHEVYFYQTIPALNELLRLEQVPLIRINADRSKEEVAAELFRFVMIGHAKRYNRSLGMLSPNWHQQVVGAD